MAGLYLLVIEGDTTGGGILDVAIDLGGFSTGTNGLFLRAASSAVNSFSPAPNVGTTISIVDFSPDLENGAQTYLIVSGFTGVIVGTDLDTDNNPANGFSNPAWTTVIDAIGVHDTGTGDFTYGAALGFTDLPVTPSGFDPEVALRLETGEWIVSDISGTNPDGPYTFDGAETLYADGSTVNVAGLNFDDVSPGNINPIPEPAATLLGGFGMLALLRRRR